jgi:hypothetical protein
MMNGRPTDPMTAQDGAQVIAEAQKILSEIKTIRDLVNGFSNRIATLQRNNADILEVLARIDTGLAENRIGRLEAELRETELERDLAERRLKILDEKVDIKKNATIQGVDTNDKIRAASASMIADLERQKKEDDEIYWRDVKRSSIKAIVISLSVGGVSAIIGFVWFLVQLYLNRGGP